MVKVQFQTKEIEKTKVSNTKVQKTLSIHRKNGKMISIQDVQDILATFTKGLGHDIILIRGYNDGSIPFTLKAFRGDLNLHEVDEYLHGKINMDEVNFTDSFYQLHLTFTTKIKKL
jgi:hypothetical protein